ncbi:2Fe-2S iron-sulfur cluster-binding protein [Streptomyces sp. NPDC093510]|uniref:2Fe-2S iron-sulfur cluster-binding protein n=1 Tax=Streptomyces sp. NPDC093510 TaxID=3155199 RepID=UPI0034304E87
MSDDQNTHNGGGWQPHPQGEYDSDATAFVQLPEGMLDVPLAAPGHGYVPPQITVTPTTADATDPAATGAWVMPPEVTGAVRWPDAGTAQEQPEPHAQPHANAQPHAHAEPHGYDPRATGQWSFPEAEHAGQQQTYGQGYAHQYGQEPAAPPADVTGQWSIPVAEGDLPDESGEFTASSLAAQWGGGTPPATLPGGAPAPWATGAGAGAPWGVQPDPQPVAEPAPEPEPQPHAQPEAQPENRFEKTQLLRAIRIPSEEPPAAEPEPAPEPELVAEPEPEPEPEFASEPVEEPVESVEPVEPVEVAAAPVPDPVPDPEPAVEAPEAAAEPSDVPDEAVTPDETAALAPLAAPVEADAEATAELDPEPEPEPEPETEAEAVPLHDDHPLVSYVLSVNGTDRPVTDAWIGESLLYVLRERLGLAGAKDGCSQGECGACNVQVDGRLVASCLVPAATTAGSEVRTVEGLAADGRPSDVQRALAACGAVQCGFCVPGMAMTVHDLLEGNPAPSDLEARRALCGNLCRCSGYRGVLDAVREVVAEREASAAAADSAAQAEHEHGHGQHGGPHGQQEQPGQNHSHSHSHGHADARIPHQAGPYGQDGGHA